MGKKKKGQCADCMYYHVGVCRYDPPQTAVNTKVEIDGWCGKFEKDTEESPE